VRQQFPHALNSCPMRSRMLDPLRSSHFQNYAVELWNLLVSESTFSTFDSKQKQAGDQLVTSLIFVASP
jgi:hypothetical protein